MRRIFWDFCRNWFLMSPLHYLSSRSDFGFEFAEIFVFEKQLPAITNTGIRGLHVSSIQGVGDSPHHWYAESPTPHITDTRSRRLPASLIRGVGESPHHQYRKSAIEFLKRKLSVSMIRRVDDSAYHRYGESTAPRIVESGSRWLRGSVMCYSKKKLIWCRFLELLTAKPCL